LLELAAGFRRRADSAERFLGATGSDQAINQRRDEQRENGARRNERDPAKLRFIDYT